MDFNKYVFISIFSIILIFSIIFKYDNHHWWLEDEVHVVQYVRESEAIEKITFMNPSGEDFDYDKWVIEDERPKPYTLVSIYKGTEITISGDIEYLKKAICEEKEKVIIEYENSKTKRLRYEIEQKVEKQKKAEDIDEIETFDCK